MLFKKQRKIETQIEEYASHVLICMDEFCTAVKRYFASTEHGVILEGYQKVHEAEGVADDIRRDIEVMMYSKALFPESRGDILGLLESIDRVPNHTESSVRMIANQHIVVPEELHGKFLDMIETTNRCVTELIEAVRSLFGTFIKAAVHIGKIDELESAVDHIEETLVDTIFSGQYDGLDKILLRDLTERIGGISDRAEQAGDRIRIMVAKRTA